MLRKKNPINRIKNLFLRVHVKNIHKLTVQQEKTKKPEIECYMKTLWKFQNFRFLQKM